MNAINSEAERLQMSIPRLRLQRDEEAMIGKLSAFPAQPSRFFIRRSAGARSHDARSRRCCGERRAIALAQPIVEKAVLVVPEPVHRSCDQGKALKEFHCKVFVGGVVIGEPQCHLQHVEAEFRHPSGAIRLLQDVAIWKHCRTVERANVVEPEEAALEHVVAACIFSSYPAGEVDQTLVRARKSKSVPPSIRNTASAAHA